MASIPDREAKRRRPRRRRLPPGTAPGTLRPAPDARQTRLEFVTYGPDEVVDYPEPDLDTVARLRRQSAPGGASACLWLNVDGLADVESVRRIGEIFDLHPLALEDVVSQHQRAKVEAYENHLFIVTRMPRPRQALSDGPLGEPEVEQVAICLGADYVVTFQELPGDVFEPVRHRLRALNGQMRRRGPDYLAYALIDAAIDGYFPLLEDYGETVEALEAEVLRGHRPEHARRIHAVKRDLLLLRRAVWPQREMLAALQREESPLVSAQTRVYLRDCYDHTIQLIDMLETYRELASNLVDIQLAAMSNRMNEIMKVLTVIATIFIPLTFISSIYGMNFDPEASPWNMPELGWRFGYPFSLLLMAAVAGGLAAWFWRKGWFSNGLDAVRGKEPDDKPDAG